MYVNKYTEKKSMRIYSGKNDPIEGYDTKHNSIFKFLPGNDHISPTKALLSR